MTHPDALPIRLAASLVVLTPAEVKSLFGERFALRGSETVFVSRGGRHEVSVHVESGPTSRLVLDALDRHALGDGLPLRLRGPNGSVDAPPPKPVRRALFLPAGLLRAWRLETGQTVTIQAGTVAFGDVTVEEGDAHVRLDRADALAARLRDGDTVRWNPHLDLAPPNLKVEEESSNVRATGRLITENDVRQARLRGQTIRVRDGQLVTPAARSLGRDLGVFENT